MIISQLLVSESVEYYIILITLPSATTVGSLGCCHLDDRDYLFFLKSLVDIWRIRLLFFIYAKSDINMSPDLKCLNIRAHQEAWIQQTIRISPQFVFSNYVIYRS